MRKNKKSCKGKLVLSAFDVVFGIDMETDVGSFTTGYEGVKHGTPKLLSIMRRRNIRATYFWTAHAAQHNPKIVERVRNAGHETGCHGMVHETLGEPIFPLPNNWPVFPFEVERRLREATKIVRKVSGKRPVSFRCPRLWGSTKVINVLEKLGYVADASFPLYFYGRPYVPYHPSSKDWTKEGRMKIVEIPNFCDLTMKSRDAYNRDRDPWPLFRVKSAKALMKKVDSFITYVNKRRRRPVVCFYFHPWEFHRMPQGAIDYGEASVRPLPMIVKNCGAKACAEFDKLCGMLKERGARFVTVKEIAKEYRRQK